MCRFHGHWVWECQGERHPPLASKSLWISPTVQPPVVRLQKRLHRFCQLKIALHVLGKVGGAHRRFLRCGDFPLLALRHFLMKLVQIRHNPSSYWFSTAKIHFFIYCTRLFFIFLLILSYRALSPQRQQPRPRHQSRARADQGGGQRCEVCSPSALRCHY